MVYIIELRKREKIETPQLLITRILHDLGLSLIISTIRNCKWWREKKSENYVKKGYIRKKITSTQFEVKRSYTFREPAYVSGEPYFLKMLEELSMCERTPYEDTTSSGL